MDIAPRVAILLLLLLSLNACSTPERPGLPPTASDLVLLRGIKLCDAKPQVLQAQATGQAAQPLQPAPWGQGEELRAAMKSLDGEASYLFDQDGTMIGAIFTFPRGLSLKPYRVLRRTLGELKPSLEFYLNVAAIVDQAKLQPITLYETGDPKSTHAYLVHGAASSPTLLMATFAIDPYAKLLSPYRRENLKRLQPVGGKGPAMSEALGAEDKESFVALQQFARAEAAHFASCGTRNDQRAAEGYGQAIAAGIADKAMLADAYYKLGLALEGTGKLSEAKSNLQQSLAVRPNVPEVFNGLGTVLEKLGERDKAIEAFERAIVLRPNYARARFNLAKAYEAIDAKRAISEYETYLALVEGTPEEESRMALARQRIAALNR